MTISLIVSQSSLKSQTNRTWKQLTVFTKPISVYLDFFEAWKEWDLHVFETLPHYSLLCWVDGCISEIHVQHFNQGLKVSLTVCFNDRRWQFIISFFAFSVFALDKKPVQRPVWLQLLLKKNRCHSHFSICTMELLYESLQSWSMKKKYCEFLSAQAHVLCVNHYVELQLFFSVSVCVDYVYFCI